MTEINIELIMVHNGERNIFKVVLFCFRLLDRSFQPFLSFYDHSTCWSNHFKSISLSQHLQGVLIYNLLREEHF